VHSGVLGLLELHGVAGTSGLSLLPDLGLSYGLLENLWAAFDRSLSAIEKLGGHHHLAVWCFPLLSKHAEHLLI